MTEIQAVRAGILNGRNYWDLPQDELQNLWETLGRYEWGYGAWEGREIIEDKNYYTYVVGSKDKGNASAKSSMRRLIQRDYRNPPPGRGARAAYMRHSRKNSRESKHKRYNGMKCGELGWSMRNSQMGKNLKRMRKEGKGVYGTSLHGNTYWHGTSTFYVADVRGELIEEGMSSKDAKKFMKKNKYNPVMEARLIKLKL